MENAKDVKDEDAFLVTFKGTSAKNIELMRQITEKEDVLDVVCGALRVYGSILIHQARGGVISFSYPEDARPENWEDTALVSYIRNKKAALEFSEKFPKFLED